MIIDRNYSMNDDINDVRLRLLDSGHAKTNEEWIGNIVSPMYARLYYIVGGAPYIMKDGEKMRLEVGKCYLFPTGYSFRHACESSMEQLYFHINLNDFNGTDLLRCAHTVMEYTPQEGVIADMLRYAHSSELIDSLRMRQEIYTSLLTLIDKYGIKLKTTHYSRCVVLAMDYIKSHLNLRLAISDLAANSFVSESTLAKKFKAEVGMTIGSYIDDVILFEAEQLLLKSDLTVLQISERFGFCDQFYFSRRFKMKYGETPQKYRKLRLI
ncbi:MAG: helix-turn-helix transcriptional regulator [Clostridia bacterium]|nr:helix-turn-helix transcriptional regulator [Clostridia bacterium]